MTIINQKSISGITSITFASAGDDLLTFHSNNGTERFRIDNSGNTKITAGIVTTLTVTGNGTVGGTLGVTGDVDVADKIVHTGDTNTAIRFPAADTFTVETAGSERLRIHADGEVQILGENAATGQTPLSVEGNYASSGNVDIQTWARSGGAVKAAMRYVDADTLLKFGTTTNHGFAFITNATEALRINSAGEVGIGTVTPGRTLHLATSGNNNVYLHLTHDGTGHTDSDGADLRLNRSTDALDIMNLENAPIKFFTNGENERVRLHAGGTLSVPTGIELGSGLDGTSANTLDDYEEGDFTPSWGLGLTSPSYITQSGRYTKIGRTVTFTFQLSTNGGTANSSGARIDGLPFNAIGTSATGGGFVFYTASWGIDDPYFYKNQNDATLSIYNQSNGAATPGNAGNGIDNLNLYVMGFYYTA